MLNKILNLLPLSQNRLKELGGIEDIKQLRRELNGYRPEAGGMEVIFYLPEGESIRVPVSNLAKQRILSREVRNYLAEIQLLKQCPAV